MDQIKLNKIIQKRPQFCFDHKKNMNFLFLISIFALFGGLVAEDAVDRDAIEICKAFHPDHVDEASTKFLNSKCSVNCYIRGYPWTHLLYENQPCPGNKDGVCHSGVCEPHTDNPLKGLGYIDINIVSASIAAHGKLYATVCIQNNTDSVTVSTKLRLNFNN